MTSIEKETLLNILELYKDMPQMWDKNHSDYMNKSLRHDGYKILLEIYKNFEPAATMKTLKKRIENMKAAYLREEKKVKTSKHTGAGSEDVYVPTLWYFDAFSFLGSTTEPCRPVKDSLGKVNEDSSLSDADTESSQPGRSAAVPIPTKKKKRTVLQKQENILDLAEKVLTMKEEDWECLGRSIGLQLRDLNEKSLTIVQKLIADAIYFAKIGRLTEDSYIVLGPNTTRPFSSYQANPYLRYPSSLSLHSPSPPLYSDAFSTSSSINSSTQFQYQLPKQSPQHRVQLSNQSPQHRVQLPYQSPQHRVQLPYHSPQHRVQLPNQSPQHRVQLPHQSPQYNVQMPNPPLPQNQVQLDNPAAQYQVQIDDPAPQYQVQLSEQLPQYLAHLPNYQDHMPDSSLAQNQVQLDDPSPQYQVQLNNSSGQYQLHILESSQDTTGTVNIQEENELSPLASSNNLVETGNVIKNFLIFNKK